MKKTLLILLSLLLFGSSFGQTEVDFDTVSKIIVNDNRIYELIDSVCAREKFRPYYTDTSCSLYMEMNFCGDSDEVDFEQLLFVDLYFRETAYEIFQGISQIGVFRYGNLNVFVIAQQRLSTLPMESIPIEFRSYPERVARIKQLREFPQSFTMLSKDSHNSATFRFDWDPIIIDDIVCSAYYQFHISRYKYDDEKFSFIDYFPLQVSTF